MPKSKGRGIFIPISLALIVKIWDGFVSKMSQFESRFSKGTAAGKRIFCFDKHMKLLAVIA
jgi:hypothetical protein